ncbi:MAG: enamine deaminase RidA [Rhodospirillaceae bacterium]|nr:enamine deaminase RidA [Rhodospirillaceae bacterium]
MEKEPFLKTRNPVSIAPPGGLYSHTVEVPPNARWLYLAGQVGIKPDGSMPDDLETQDDQMWRNVIFILDDANFGVEDIVKINVYSTVAEALPIHAENRVKYLNGNHIPASTWVVVKELAKPDILIEMDIVAAKSGKIQSERS